MAVNAWVLNGRLLTVSASAPAELEKSIVNSLMFHSGYLQVATHLGVDPSA